MKIVVIGGSGLIGRHLTAELKRAGHEAVPASPSTGVDAVTGAGLAQVLVGADTVVDVANAPSFEEAAVRDFFERSSRNLLAAGRQAGVKHHVALSIVGADRADGNGYFRAKVAQS
uniref:SDR family oxidoreductase n=1 Tax=Methylobacterium sp. B34 TaxID=95563 RepID=UPI0005B2D709